MTIFLGRNLLQKERYELKYLVPESAVSDLRSFVRTYLAPDKYVTRGGPVSYQVNTLYLDAPSLLLCRQTQDGIRNRFKLRMRWYDSSQESPAFVEIKQRTDDMIHKLRAQVTKQEMQLLVQGGCLPFSSQDHTNEIDVVAEFCDRRDRLLASEIVLVTYAREAYESPLGNHARVTFDREIRGQCCGGDNFGLLENRQSELSEISDGKVVMEVKFTQQMPGWISDLIRIFHLQRVSFPKYVACVEALGISSSTEMIRN